MSEKTFLIRNVAREFAEKYLKPVAKKIDEENRIPEDIINKAREMGFFALRVPEEYGGPGLSLQESVSVVEELAYASSALAIMSVVSGDMVAYPIMRYGTDEQKEKYLSLLGRGGIGAFALTEPCCGSDAAAIETRATREGDYYVITGQKIFITNAPYADFFLVAARTGRPEDRHRGVSLFILDKSPCIKISKMEMMGYRGSGTSTLYLEDCRVPTSNIIGRENEGFKKIMMALNEGRITTAATGLGIMRAAFDLAFEYSNQRKSMGKLLIDHQMVQYMLSEMATLIEASRLLIYEAARASDENRSDLPKLSSMAKLFTAKSGVDVVRMAMQILGGIGYSRDSDVERLYRDIKMIEIGDGTNEVQRMVIIRSLQGRIRLE